MAGASRTSSFLVISSSPSGSAPPLLRDEGLLSEASQRHHPVGRQRYEGSTGSGASEGLPSRGSHVLQSTTIGSFTSKDVNGTNGIFEIGFDANADRRSNYRLDVFFAAGRFRGVVVKPNGTVITYDESAVRVSPRSVKVTWALAGIVRKGSYDFAAFSVFGGSPCSRKSACVDAIPNRSPLLRHDFTRPFFSWGSVPLYSTDASATLTFPVSFNVTDDIYGSGVKSWTLQKQVVGASTWVTVQKGTARHPTVQVVGLEATSYDLRVVVVDRQGNKRVSGAFLGTTTSIADTGTVAFTMPFDVTDICVVGGPTTGPASSTSVSAPTPIGGTIVEGGSTPARDRTCVGVPVTSGTVVTMTSSSAEPFVLDGIILVP
jgi:hypothetical protein